MAIFQKKPETVEAIQIPFGLARISIAVDSESSDLPKLTEAEDVRAGTWLVFYPAACRVELVSEDGMSEEFVEPKRRRKAKAESGTEEAPVRSRRKKAA